MSKVRNAWNAVKRDTSALKVGLTFSFTFQSVTLRWECAHIHNIIFELAVCIFEFRVCIFASTLFTFEFGGHFQELEPLFWTQSRVRAHSQCQSSSACLLEDTGLFWNWKWRTTMNNKFIIKTFNSELLFLVSRMLGAKDVHIWAVQITIIERCGSWTKATCLLIFFDCQTSRRRLQCFFLTVRNVSPSKASLERCQCLANLKKLNDELQLKISSRRRRLPVQSFHFWRVFHFSTEGVGYLHVRKSGEPITLTCASEGSLCDVDEVKFESMSFLRRECMPVSNFSVINIVSSTLIARHIC